MCAVVFLFIEIFNQFLLIFFSRVQNINADKWHFILDLIFSYDSRGRAPNCASIFIKARVKSRSNLAMDTGATVPVWHVVATVRAGRGVVTVDI